MRGGHGPRLVFSILLAVSLAGPDRPAQAIESTGRAFAGLDSFDAAMIQLMER